MHGKMITTIKLTQQSLHILGHEESHNIACYAKMHHNFSNDRTVIFFL